MRHCFLCGGDFPDETRMVNARGSNICLPCAQTERGKRQTENYEDRVRAGYRVGQHRGDDFKKALFYWEHGYRRPR